jgi:hypothetical protein
MTYHMFLDDVRDPNWVYPDQDTSDWIVCRTVPEAQHVIEDLGWPEFLSFDHDLGDQIPTGYDLAHWLVERDLDQADMPDHFEFKIHSANPIGAENIRSLLTKYMRMRGG